MATLALDVLPREASPGRRAQTSQPGRFAFREPLREEIEARAEEVPVFRDGGHRELRAGAGSFSSHE